MRVFSMLLMSAAAVVVAMLLSTTAPGCGPGTPDVDKSALYTPESLAEELAFRYRALKPEARKSTRGAESGSKAARRAAALDRARQAEKKTGDAEPVKKRSGPPTLDDVLADIDVKINKVPKTPRPEVCRKMIEALSKDASLSADDRKVLSDRLGEMGSS
jgi:hypothetical protein